MKTNKTITGGGIVYTAPLCTTTDIRPEGVLCSSIEGLGNTFDYIWGDEE